MTLTVFEIWEQVSPLGGVCHTLIKKGDFEKEAHLFEGTPILLKTFEAGSYNEAAQVRNDFFGWGEYIPMDDDEEDSA
ncbi:MAG: hypothetical protein JO067_15005 [Cupriavidus sp.]|nr:hypothetical protein [Cupriavidus sp.]